MTLPQIIVDVMKETKQELRVGGFRLELRRLCERFARFIANQGNCKLVGTFASNDSSALNPSHDERGRRSNRLSRPLEN